MWSAFLSDVRGQGTVRLPVGLLATKPLELWNRFLYSDIPKRKFDTPSTFYPESALYFSPNTPSSIALISVKEQISGYPFSTKVKQHKRSATCFEWNLQSKRFPVPQSLFFSKRGRQTGEGPTDRSCTTALSLPTRDTRRKARPPC